MRMVRVLRSATITLHRSALASTSSALWKQRQRSDPFVREALRLGYRSRAALKLVQIDQKLRFLREGQRALELGCAPGSWTQVLVERQLEVFGLDELPMQPLPGAHIVQGSLADSHACETLLSLLGGELVDHVLSDISPPRSGHLSLDHARLTSLLLRVLFIARRVLRPGGSVLMKALQGEDYVQLVRALRMFGAVSIQKPAASRRESAELYIFLHRFDHDRFDGAISTLQEIG
mmetsp:Transcript_54779/g.126145  ORF Transcript_54779/g.126145 Transcript_54779/m.126145 type:complete len:234 (-) Transcript_54779:28-729(-)